MSEDADGMLPELYKPEDNDSSVDTEEDKEGHNKVKIQPRYEDKTLASITIPTNFKILETPNVWIADTGATIHNTPHDI